ncbi:single-stranded-DNA-specific exonuclease RecJ [Novosphingobium sp.]|uniref:single-stranded-DNA-specific exonuclease RecJ n=1 Tax=Novosphingobium sp. TaxID=1874826 RepID=UPI00333E98D2
MIKSISTIDQSLSGLAWRWRGGNMDFGTDDIGGHGAGSASAAGDDLIDQLLLSRGIDRADLDRQRRPTLREFLPDPSIFRDMDTAAARLASAICAGEAIAVYGDYDVDGATSAALLIRFLRMCGHDARAYIPDRLLEGYGPSGAALVRLGAEGAQLVITVDCGAMAHEALAMAAAAGVAVIVVDHHKCGAELPVAVALVNPNRLDESDAAAAHGHLAAVGMAFLLAVATARDLRTRGFFGTGSPPDLMGLLDLVALGTVADVAQLRGLNRALVAQGLKVMARRDNVGLAALIDASRLGRSPGCSDLGFALGPRINAAGRIGDSSLGVRLLTTLDGDEAATIAAQLSLLNDERRGIEQVVQEAAEAELARKGDCTVNVLAGPGWHPGVIGIVAGRIKEKTGRPTLIIGINPDEALADQPGNDTRLVGKGSGRSIVGVDLGAAVIAARDAGLLVAGGGHAMACGLTIDPDRIDALRDFLQERLARDVARARATQTLLIDLSLAPGGLTPDLVTTLEAAGPFGIGWPGPRVAIGPVRLVKCEPVGTDHVRMVATGNDGRSFKAIAFRAAPTALGQALLHGHRGRHFWLAGRARIDDWGKRPAAELHVDDAAFAD